MFHIVIKLKFNRTRFFFFLFYEENINCIAIEIVYIHTSTYGALLRGVLASKLFLPEQLQLTSEANPY